MIYIDKKTFYFLQNVLKCTVFSYLHLKFAKRATMTQKILFVKNINIGIKKAEFYTDFKFVDAGFHKCP